MDEPCLDNEECAVICEMLKVIFDLNWLTFDVFFSGDLQPDSELQVRGRKWPWESGEHGQPAVEDRDQGFWK